MDEAIPERIKTGRASHMVRSLATVWDMVKQNVYWVLGNGRTINFWTDEWITEIRKLLPHCLDTSRIDTEAKATELVAPNGE